MNAHVLAQSGSLLGGNVSLVTALLIFVIGGIVMVLGALLVGKLLRTRIHHPEKDAAYECGEPAIGTSWVQFDLRFYVVALVFVVFDVEIALFYPWAVVFGGGALEGGGAEALRQVQFAALWDMLFFFGVLVVGFLYLWRYGYLDWVRAIGGGRARRTPLSGVRSSTPAESSGAAG